MSLIQDNRQIIGSKNLGNSCYLNAVFQFLCTIDPIVQYIRKNAPMTGPYQELISEFKDILDTLETEDSIKTILISQLEKEIEFHKELNDHNDILIRYRDEEIQLLNEQIDLYNKRLNQVDKWYKKPWVGAVGMVFFLHAVNYTLPQ